MQRVLLSLFGIAAIAITVWFHVPEIRAGYDPQGPYRLKDFAIIQRDGVWHVFAIHTCPPGQGLPHCDPTPRGFIHMTSRDLRNWVEHEFVAAPDGQGWNADDVWAPTVVEQNGTYYLFFTGVDTINGRDEQKIGYITSTDLANWSAPPAEATFSCAQISWAYWNPSDSIGTDCRDPFITWDADRNLWTMVYATRIVHDAQTDPYVTRPMILGLATSPDLLTWTDAGPVASSKHYLAESAHMFEHNGSWYMARTTNNGIKYATSPDIQGPYTNIGNLPGIPSGSFGSEYASAGAQEYLLFISGYSLESRLLQWPNGIPAVSLLPSGTVSGSIWADTDSDGLRTPSEPGINGVTVELYGDDGDQVFEPHSDDWPANTGTTSYGFVGTTYQSGVIQINDVPVGPHWIAMAPESFEAPQVLEGRTLSAGLAYELVNVTNGQTVSRNFGYRPGGYTWTFGSPADYLTTGGLSVTQRQAVGSEGSISPISGEARPFAIFNQLSLVGAAYHGTVKWNLSNNGGATWLYFDGTSWSESDGSSEQSSPLSQINAHAAAFPVGSGQLLWRAVCSGSGTQACVMSAVHASVDSAPSAPALQAPADGAVVGTLYPIFSASAVDAQDNTLMYELQLDTAPTFDSPDLRVIDQSLDQVGWQNRNADNFSRYVSGSVASYLAQGGVPNGLVYWRMRALDPAGSGQFSPWSETRMIQAPGALTILSPSVEILSTTSVRVHWTTSNPAHGYADYWGPTGDSLDTGSLSTSHTILLTGLVPNGQYWVQLYSEDGYGQWAEHAAIEFTPRQPTIISNLKVVRGWDSATISWTTNQPSTGTIAFGPTTALGQTVSHANLKTSHKLVISGLDQLTTYFFQVASTGSTTATSSVQNFQTTADEVIATPRRLPTVRIH